MSYYIKGNKERGAEVIALLESKGGINSEHLSGENSTCYYYIEPATATIYCASSPTPKQNLKTFCDELTLPEPEWEPKFKVGDKVEYKDKSINGEIHSINLEKKFYVVKSKSGLKYLWGDDDLHPYEWEPKRGESVLVRFNCFTCWREARFSFKDDINNYYYVVGGNYYFDCIPFDINKLGKVTD